jgi:ABC-type phosphate/phosphonate transport system substrate-binding protein
MKIQTVALFLVSALCCLDPAFAGTLGGHESGEVFLGVINPRGSDATYKRYSPLAQYFSAAAGAKVTVVPLEHERNLPYLRDGKVDFLLTNPTVTAAISRQLDVELLANLDKDSGYRFGGVIFSKTGSGIATLQDIRNKRVLAYQIRESAGGHIFQSYHLLTHGINEQADLAWLREAKSQDFVVEAVQRGNADVGFVRTGILEAMAAEQKIRMEDFTIVDRVDDPSFAQVRTTALYPEWYLVAGPHTSAQLRRVIKDAALAIKEDMDVAKATDIRGFVPPLDLAPLIEVLEALRIPPFDSPHSGEAVPSATAGRGQGD